MVNAIVVCGDTMAAVLNGMGMEDARRNLMKVIETPGLSPIWLQWNDNNRISNLSKRLGLSETEVIQHALRFYENALDEAVVTKPTVLKEGYCPICDNAIKLYVYDNDYTFNCPLCGHHIVLRKVINEECL